MRNKMIELIQESVGGCSTYWAGVIADHIIANGGTIATDNNGGCKYCTEYEDLPEHFIDGEPYGKVFDTCIQDDENGWHIELPYTPNIGILFCPMCGRRLPEPPQEEV